MKYSGMAIKMFKLVRKYLNKYYPDEADELMRKTEEYYLDFLKECPDIGGKDNMLAENLDMGLIVFAAYEASDHRMGKEAIGELMEYRMDMLRPLMKILDVNKKWIVKLMYLDYELYAKKLNKKLANGEWGNTWGMGINPDNRKDGFAFTLYGCPIAEFARKHGYEELMPCLCASDHLLAEAMHSKLIRTHTVALGSDSCDYWYVGDKSETAEKYPLEKVV